MRVIKRIASIRKLRDEGNISAALAEHIEAKVERLKDMYISLVEYRFPVKNRPG